MAKQWKIYEKECQASKQKKFFKNIPAVQLILLIKSSTEIMRLFMKLNQF